MDLLDNVLMRIQISVLVRFKNILTYFIHKNIHF
jgi:hypothetical protein